MKFRKFVVFVMIIGLSVGVTGCGSEERRQAQDGYRQYGINCMQKGNYEEAEDAFQKALDQSVGGITEMEIDTCFYKAQAQYLAGDVAGACETYSAIIDYNGDARAYYLRGSLFYQTGYEQEEGQGQADFDEAIGQDDENYELYVAVYEALKEAGDPQANAKSYLEKALEIKGEEPEDLFQKGRIYYRLEEYETAKDLLERAQSEGLNEAYEELANVYEALGDSNAAEAAFEAYLESGEADADGLQEIGDNLMKRKRYIRAIRCYDTALGMEDVSNRQSLLRNLILAHEYCGNFMKAKDLCAEYVEAYPEDEEMVRENVFLQTR